MHRRTLLAGLLALAASPALAQSNTLNDLSGVTVLSRDGALVGITRDTRILKRDRLRLFVRDAPGSLFRRLDEDVIIDVPVSQVSLTAQGIVLPASAQTLRNRLYYEPRLNDPGRITLR